jgi:hypothetical protein
MTCDMTLMRGCDLRATGDPASLLMVLSGAAEMVRGAPKAGHPSKDQAGAEGAKPEGAAGEHRGRGQEAARTRALQWMCCGGGMAGRVARSSAPRRGAASQAYSAPIRLSLGD